MAVKIVRQPNKIALIGAPSSAAGFALGTEKAPAALRRAGLVERLQNAGYEVTDHGDCPPRLFADDDDHRRARNVPAIVAALNDLKPHVEVATKTGALVLVLGGDCSQTIAVLSGARRYYKHLNLLWVDRDADLNTPASTPSGRIDGMVVAHIIGKGAPELVRFWGEPPLVREPDITLFGIDRLDPPEQELLSKSPLRHMLAVDIQSKGASRSTKEALAQLHADGREFVLHLDLDVIDSADMPAVNVPGSGGLRLDEFRAAFTEFVRHPHLIALDVAQYNPDKDPDGTAAGKVVDILVEALSARLHRTGEAESSAAAAPPVDTGSAATDAAAPPDAEHEASAAASKNPVPAESSSPGAEAADAPTSESGEDRSTAGNAFGARSSES